MALQSDITLNWKKFEASAVSLETAAFNSGLQKIMEGIPQWYEIGAPKYRALRAGGLSALPGRTLLHSALDIQIPSRDQERAIPCRLLRPENSTPKGIFLHMHGGGWVLNDEKSSDVYLQKLANTCSLLCISIGYRLAPEFPFPAGAHDCYDVAEWLLDNGVAEYGAPLSFIGGESAGANLAIVTVLHLATSPIPRYANHRLLGFIGHYGAYSLQWTPSLKNFKREPALVLDENIMTSFRTAYVPEHRVGDLTSPEISPLYANLEGLSLPPAIFTCGTEDCLRDDSAFMSVKWMMAGAEAVVRFYPGSPHGFILFSGEVHENAALAFQDVTNFVMPKMSQGVRSTL